jgi:hypothetical protein
MCGDDWSGRLLVRNGEVKAGYQAWLKRKSGCREDYEKGVGMVG